MGIKDGSTLWFGVFLLLVVLKSSFVAGKECDIPKRPLLTENVLKDTTVYNFTDGNWNLISSIPTGYFYLENNSAKYYLRVKKEIDVEVMKQTTMEVNLICNGPRRIFFLVFDVNEFPPKFNISTFKISIPEGTMKGKKIFNAALHTSDADFSPHLTYTATEYTSPKVPLDGISSKMFKVTSDGSVEITGDLDYEKVTQYGVIINVKESPFNDTMTLIINVLDRDDMGPVFTLPSSSKPILDLDLSPVYNSEMSVNYTGELTILPIPIEAKDLETDNYSVTYSIVTAIPTSISNYFNIDSASGKITVVQMLPTDVPSQLTLYIQAEDVSPLLKHKTYAILVVSLTDKTTPLSPQVSKSDQTSTTPLQVSKSDQTSDTIASGVFYGVLAALLVVILILAVALSICFWQKSKKNAVDDEEADFKDSKSASFVSSSVFTGDYDSNSVLTTGSGGRGRGGGGGGIYNNGADLTDEQLPPPPNSQSCLDIASSKNNFMEDAEEMEENENEEYEGLSSSSGGTDDDDVDKDVVATAAPPPPPSENTYDNNSDADLTQAGVNPDTPVTMTFADLNKTNSVRFADDKNLYCHNSDNDGNNDDDAVSYVDLINNDDGDSNSTDKTLETSKLPESNADEMTWLVAEGDGDQQKLSYNNEIGYAPLQDDSQRDSPMNTGGDDDAPFKQDIRL